MKQAEDTILREYLVSTASQYNCQGGVNGRNVAVVKSLLMDLKLLAGNAEDNKAQAAEMLAA